MEKPLYVSLFGVRSSRDIDLAIVRAMWPKTDSDISKIGTQVKNFISGLRVFGVSVDLSKIDLTEVMLSKLPDTLIFDDLERARIPVTELLGALNGYVEHGGKRVVLLANEDSLWGEDGGKEKEKVIGQTLSIIADYDAAIQALIDRYGLKSKDFLARNVETIKDVFTKAGYNNLRSLGQSIWEFERLYKSLDKVHLENKEGMNELLFVFLALTLEVKSGNFTRKDLRLRDGMDLNSNPDFEKLRQAKVKFGTEQIQNGSFNTVLPSKLAEYIICDGGNDSKKINDELAHTPAFHIAEEENEWQTVWWAHDREEDLVTAAVSSMETKFLKREYLDPGTILHVFSSRLGLPEMGYSECSVKEIEEECVKYIEDLKEDKKLVPYDPVKEAYHMNGYGYSDTGHLGMGFPRDTNSKSPHFKRLFEKMRAMQMEAYLDCSPEDAADLLRLLEEDPNSFSTKVSGHDLKLAVFAKKPVLHHLDPKAFVEQLLELPQKHRREALFSLERRYENSGNELKVEKPWLKTVGHEIESQIQHCSSFLKWQIQNDLNHSIVKTLKKWEEDVEKPETGKGDE